MNGSAWVGCALLLAWAPWSQASLNSAHPDVVLGERLTATCSTQAVERADWGDITAVVQSVRLCLRRGDGRQGAERKPGDTAVGLAQRSIARAAARALAEKTP
ncbi:hypothetical protein MXL79_13480 [Serratia ureilytica]|uniref:hypothetical protein n=1 Tax=Serratia ureilytica TaxID=300181 RepID=UPI000B8EC824|nr:hypothetical protein [Serratia ureilytica]MEB5994163.1 hypothetical protein [Serratia ureilytica]